MESNSGKENSDLYQLKEEDKTLNSEVGLKSSPTLYDTTVGPKVGLTVVPPPPSPPPCRGLPLGEVLYDTVSDDTVSRLSGGEILFITVDVAQE